MSVINTNITSLIAQQNLVSSKGDLTTAMERLSSGLRINSAADDAAGQAIANRMSAQITGLSQAQRNANDGISVAQTTEGALNQINDNLQRIRELSVQAQNDTNSQEDLNSIQDEIGQRLKEIDRISEETSFNGVKVLAKDQELSIQVGANDGETITLNLKEINAETLSLNTFNVDGVEGAAAASNTQIDDFLTSNATAVTSGTVTALTGGNFGFGATAAASSSGTVFADESGNLYAKVTIDGTALTASEVEDLAEQGISVDTSSQTNVTYLALEEDEATVSAGGTTTFDATTDAQLSELSMERSASPLAALDSALSDVDSLRSELGAMQNRFDSAISNLATNETNLAAARSRIEDADYAVEVSNMTRAQILQQAGTSVLAQANQVPQGVLSLLG
jgi:flagellin